MTFFQETRWRPSETMSAEQIVPYTLTPERRHRPVWPRRKIKLDRRCGGRLPLPVETPRTD